VSGSFFVLDLIKSFSFGLKEGSLKEEGFREGGRLNNFLVLGGRVGLSSQSYP
jgi:hypothetical protein